MSGIRSRLKTEDITKLLDQTAVNDLILAGTVNSLVNSTTVNSKITVSRISELLNSATIKNQIISLFTFSEVFVRSVIGQGNDQWFYGNYLEDKGHYRLTDVNGAVFEFVKNYSGIVPSGQSVDLGTHYLWSNGSQNGVRPNGGSAGNDLVIVKIERKEALS